MSLGRSSGDVDKGWSEDGSPESEVGSRKSEVRSPKTKKMLILTLPP